MSIYDRVDNAIYSLIITLNNLSLMFSNIRENYSLVGFLFLSILVINHIIDTLVKINMLVINSNL
jgi:hypothetical protein